MEATAKKGGTNGGRGKATKRVAKKKEVRATCLLDGVVAPEEMKFLGSTKTCIDRIRDGFKAVTSSLDDFDEDLTDLDEVTTQELMPLVESFREVCPPLRKSLDMVIAATTRNGQPEQRMVEQIWAVLRTMHDAATVVMERVQHAWMEIGNLVDDDNYNPGWIVTMSNVAKNLCHAMELAFAALTVARLRAGQPVCGAA